ncbi:MAG: C1 family peptidase [Candidatus Eisenbacteria bacterium]
MLVTGILAVSSAGDTGAPSHVGAVGTANPAAVYCTELGYKYKIVSEPNGQRGVCVFPDGSECDEWEFFEGTCGQQWSYCAKCGYGTVTRKDGKNPFSPSYAVCVSKDGKEIGSVTDLMKLPEKCIRARAKISPDVLPSPLRYPPKLGSQAPPSFDWRNYNGQNWMTPVKNQGLCGSCWAFAAVGAVEAGFNILNNNPTLDYDLSEQQLVSDCCRAGDCNGGRPQGALYHAGDPGLDFEVNFPYTAANGPCQMLVDPQASNGVNIIAGGANEMKEYISSTGPVIAQIDISDGYWDLSSCVYRGPGTSLNHEVVILGYDDAGGYWIAKNSNGTSWPAGVPQCVDGGYFKIGYGECGIESYVYYPIMDANAPVQCGKIIKENTALSQDLLNCPETALFIGGRNLTLDGANHQITGDASQWSGITIDNTEYALNQAYLNNNKCGVTVQNCRIRGFAYGIHLNFTGLSSSQGNYLVNNTAEYNSTSGIYLSNSSYNELTSNTVNNNSSGIAVQYSSNNNKLTSNTANNNGGDGIYIGTTAYPSDSIALIGNVCNDNGRGGIFLIGSSNSTLTENHLSNNTSYGVRLYFARYNTFYRNVFVKTAGTNAYETSNCSGNSWDHADSGNYWDDFSTNEGYPYTYVIAGPGDGVDHFPNGGAAGVLREDVKGRGRITFLEISPSPFKYVANIRFGLDGPSALLVRIYDTSGRMVTELGRPEVKGGEHTVSWDGRDARGEPMASGFYFCRIEAGGTTQTRKIILAR